MDTFIPLLSIAAGLVLLFSGRKVFWLAAALAAFLFVYNLLQNMLEPGLYGLVIAAAIGVVLVWLAVNFIKTAGVIVGALAGAVGLPYLLTPLGVELSWWILALIGAVAGIVIVALAFDWGLIVMTSWLGANVVAGDAGNFLPVTAAVSAVIFVLLLVAGIVVQAGQLRKK